MSKELIEWASTFEALGNPTRLGILLVLYASDTARKDANCLTFSEIKEIMRIPSDSVLDYHLKCLVDTQLVKKTATSSSPSGRVYPLYRTTEKAVAFLQTTEKAVAFLEKVGLAEATRELMKEDEAHST
jgi:DNA-binding transcriptional ArsR family regulator